MCDVDTAVKQEIELLKQQEKKGQQEVKSAYWGMFDRPGKV